MGPQLKHYRAVLIGTCLVFLLLLTCFGAVPSASAAPLRIGYWAGYGFDGIHNPTYPHDPPQISQIWGVSAWVKVPCIGTTGPLGTFHAWVGMGGVRSNYLIRAGVSAGSYTDRNGQRQTSYWAWVATPSQWQRVMPFPYLTFFYFKCDTTVGYATVQLDVHANGYYHIAAGDGTHSRTINSRSMGTLDATTAEFVVEGAGPTLARSGSVDFSSCRLLGRNELGNLGTYGLLEAVSHRLNRVNGVIAGLLGSEGSGFSVSSDGLPH